MVRRVGDVMTSEPQALPLHATLYEAARVMRDKGIGDVLVTDGERLCGMVTDRDIVVRAVAERRNTVFTSLAEVCTAELAVLGPDDDTDTAVRLMREHAVRRLPVVDGRHRPIGIVTVGDLMLAGLDGPGPLSEISKAPPGL